MTLAVRLALRNLARNRRRTALTAVSLIAGVGLLILGKAFIGGVNEGIVVGAENGLTGHVLARPAGYPAQGFQHPVDRLIALTPQARAWLDRETAGWTARLVFSPQLTAGRETLRVRAVGYDPATDERVFSRALWNVRGALPDPARDEILVGRGVASLLKLKPGDRVVLQCRTHRGAVNALDVAVSGLVAANNTVLDVNAILLPMPLARTLIAADGATHVAIRLPRREDAAAFRPRLLAALGAQAEAVTWEDEVRDLLFIQAMRMKALSLVIAVLMTLAGLGTANTILMAAHERVREVGMLRALGMTDRTVRALFLWEGGLLGFGGSLLGAAWGSALAFRWSRHPLNFGEHVMGEAGGDLALSSLIFTAFDPAVVALAVAFGAGVAVVASAYPARVASRVPPAEAIRADA